MVEHVVHVAAQESARILIAQEPGTRRVGERATTSQVNPIDRLGCGIEQEPDVFFTLAQCFVSTVAFDAESDFVSRRVSSLHGCGVGRPICEQGLAVVGPNSGFDPCQTDVQRSVHLAGQLRHKSLIFLMLFQQGFLLGMLGKPAGQILFDRERVFQ